MYAEAKFENPGKVFHYVGKYIKEVKYMIAEKVSIEKMLKKFWAIQECMDTAVHNILNGKEPDDEYLERFDFGGFGIRHCGTEKINYLHVVKLGTEPLKVLPQHASSMGYTFAWYGDENARGAFMNKEDVLEFAEIYGEFVLNFLTNL